MRKNKGEAERKGRGITRDRAGVERSGEGEDGCGKGGVSEGAEKSSESVDDRERLKD